MDKNEIIKLARTEADKKLTEFNNEIAKTEKILPFLGALKLVKELTLVWKDSGSGAKLNGAFFRPVPPSGYLIFGHFGWPGHKLPKDLEIGTLALKADGPVPWKYPVDYEKIWSYDNKSFWRPIPAKGYKILGMISQITPIEDKYRYLFPPIPISIFIKHIKPKLNEIVCVREDFTESYDPEVLIWNDRGSGMRGKISVWLVGRLGTIFVHASYKDPDGTKINTLADQAMKPLDGKPVTQAIKDTVSYTNEFQKLGQVVSGIEVIQPIAQKNYLPLCDAIINQSRKTRPSLPIIFLDGILPWKYPKDFKENKLSNGWTAWQPIPEKDYFNPGVLLRKTSEKKPSVKEIVCLPREFFNLNDSEIKLVTNDKNLQFKTNPKFGAFSIINNKKEINQTATLNESALLLSQKPIEIKI